MSSSMGSFVPENVKNFIHYFRRHVNEANVPGILSMYETMWPYDAPPSPAFFRCGTLLRQGAAPVSYTHLTLPTTPYV